jgi:hypothetical protein
VGYLNMAAVFGHLVTACCGALVTLIIFAIGIVLQNLPGILDLLKNGWDGLIQLTYHLYRYFIEDIPNYLGFKSLTGILLVAATIILSLFICICISLLLKLSIRWWSLSLAFAHGIYIGLAWKRLANSDGLYLGRWLE